MVSCDGVFRLDARSVCIHQGTSLSIDARHPHNSAPELVADAFGRKALAFVPEAQEHVVVIIPLDERIVLPIVLRAIRRDTLRRAEGMHIPVIAFEHELNRLDRAVPCPSVWVKESSLLCCSASLIVSRCRAMYPSG